jgi:phage-related holin
MIRLQIDPTYFEALCKYGNQIKTAIYSVFIFLNIDVDVVKILIWLMIIDTGFGIVKSVVMGRRFSFKRLFMGLSIKTLVILIPMTLALVSKGLNTYDFTPLVDIVLKILLVSEGYSILTSMYVIKTKKDVKELDIVTLLLESLRKGLRGLIEMWLGKLENMNNYKDK